MTEVDSLTKLDTKTYFWDRTTEHLYVIFKNTNDGQSPDPQWVYYLFATSANRVF